MHIVGFFVILENMEKDNYKKWENFVKKNKKPTEDIDVSLCATLLANQEKFEKKTIMDVAKENHKKNKKRKKKK